MKRSVTKLFIVFMLLLGISNSLIAQGTTADNFLESISAHPANDEAERDLAFATNNSLYTGSREEVERVLPSVLRYTQTGNNARVRTYAVGFLLGIAMRPDGADLLSSKSDEISLLIVDRDPTIQRGGVAITDYVIGRPGTNKRSYMSALGAAIRMPQTPQDIAVGMAGPLLSGYRAGDPQALKSVLEFLGRDDLTAETRMATLHGLATMSGLPEEVALAMSKDFDDANPRVRAQAVIAFALSNSTFHNLVKNRVERMAADTQEHPQVRALAKQALAGQTDLNPNIDVPPREPRPASSPAGSTST